MGHLSSSSARAVTNLSFGLSYIAHSPACLYPSHSLRHCRQICHLWKSWFLLQLLQFSSSYRCITTVASSNLPTNNHSSNNYSLLCSIHLIILYLYLRLNVSLYSSGYMDLFSIEPEVRQEPMRQSQNILRIPTLDRRLSWDSSEVLSIISYDSITQEWMLDVFCCISPSWNEIWNYVFLMQVTRQNFKCLACMCNWKCNLWEPSVFQ